MKYFSSDNVFQFPWNQVTQAFWVRYPNPYSKHVISEDTIARKVVGSKLYITRLIIKANISKLPKCMERFVPSLGKTPMCIVEESIVDRKKQTLTTYTRNIVMARILSIEEKCVYKRNTENSDWTVCERKAWISSSLASRYGLAYAIQTYGYDRFKRGLNSTFKGYEHVLTQMFRTAEHSTTTHSAGHSLHGHSLHGHHLNTIRDKARDKVHVLKDKAVHVVSSSTNLG